MSRTSKLAEDLRSRVTKAVVSYAFFRLESAILIGFENRRLRHAIPV